MTHSNIGIVIDSDAFFEIDPITRSIKNMTPSKIAVMQNDHNSERFTFSIPRYVEGHDMSTSDKVEVHYINIDSVTKEQSTGIYEMTDLKIESEDTEKVSCSWLLSRNATKHAGKLSFLVRFVCLDGDEIDYAWNTSVFDGISVGAGLNVSDEFPEEYVDIIEAWKTELQAEINVWVDESVNSQVDVAKIRQNTNNIGKLGTDLNILEARVGNLLKAETVDGELIDVRVGHDGTVYPSAGEAVREQIKPIAENVTELDDLKIVSSASGESIHLADSSNEKFRGLKLYGKTKQSKTTGKNLFPNFITDTTLNKGSTVKVNSDSSLTVHKVAGEQIMLYTDVDFPKGTYTLSNGMGVKHLICVQAFGKTTQGSPSVKVEWEGGTTRIILYASNTAEGDVTLKPQIEIGGTATEYEPYTGGLPAPSPEYPQEMNSPCYDGSVDVSVFGKNLLPIKVITPSTYAGITYTPQDNGTITVNGTANSDEDSVFHFVKKESPLTLKKGTYYISGSEGGSDTTYRIMLYSTDWKLIAENRDAPKSFTLEEDTDVFCYIWVARGTTIDKTFKPMISTSIEDFEPYKKPQSLVIQDIKQTHIIDANINLYVQFCGLFGIPVTSGGNYTDANGQQWVCDEIDLARGVYVQRIKQHWLTGEESWGVSGIQSGMKEGFTRYDCAITAPTTLSNDSLWSHFQYNGTVAKNGYGAWVHPGSSTKVAFRIVSDHASVDELKSWLADKNANFDPVTVQYILETPIETPLTDEEIEAFKALHTNKLVTNIFNDEGAWMSADYVADPKTYIDNKFLELEKTILNTTT